MKSVFTVLAVIISSSLIGQISILEENFDSSSLPANFTIIDNDGNTVANDVQEYTSAWIIKEDPTDATNGTASSTSYFSPVDRADRWLITSQMTLGASGNFISWSGLSHDASFPDSYKVMISKTGNSIADFTDTLVVVSNELPVWNKHTENLEDYAGETVYFAFVNTTYDGYKLYLDSIYVREQDPLSTMSEEINLAIYPNPVLDEIDLNTSNVLIENVEIFNSFGQKVMGEKMESSAFKAVLDVSELGSGVYFVVVETSAGVVRRKVIK
ncbi:T9SS-dependent choice-of-anchor J family protein [Brumimicrobium oceani]|uniref:Secretion system C-terminal sorting domain-containing protein n=1 Tax=Brumimicrobium oceani TaxID=2100725 RepID=A0A2U2XEZ6_9FLAO|nr:choice-of-anchor J domain-containing protein [Brumimicrobium oceani]PWH86365.1 hypothetical protein DIT68_03750 [Brumimicrobium oceani]